MRITQEQFDEWLRNNPVLAKRNPEINSNGVRSSGPESDSGMPLECSASGKTQGDKSTEGCFMLTFTVYAHRNPRDADNLRTKELQDALVIAGLLPDDNWKIISEVRLRSRKAASKKEERTEIIIYQL